MRWAGISRRSMLWLAAVLMLLLMSVFSAMSAANTVPPQRIVIEYHCTCTRPIPPAAVHRHICYASHCGRWKQPG